MKRVIMGVAVCAFLLSSCSQNEKIAFESTDDSNAVNFMLSTTRGVPMTLELMQFSAPISMPGFKVYATSGAIPTTWCIDIDGTNNYKYASGAWNWNGNKPKWPTATTAYPMNFYAYFPSVDNSYGTPTVTPGTALSIPITIQQDVINQNDLLAAKASTVSKPGDGFLPLTFKHILAKLNFGVIAGAGTNVKVQSVSVKNVKNKNTYDYLAGTWNTTSAGSASYDYWGNNQGGAILKATFTPPIADGTTGNLIWAENAHAIYQNMMLLPQTSPAWDKTIASLSNGGYIEVVYRITNTDGTDKVGYTNATQHPQYAILGAGVTGALFVKVGFPLGVTDFTWEPGKGYIYNIKLGTSDSTGGYLTQDTYVDENGNNTNLKVGAKKTGDPVSDGTINFRLKVVDWNNQTATPIQ